MQLIRCTKWLRKEMGLKQSDLCAREPRFSYFRPWHANLIHIDRRKCVLFVNDKTLFNFIVPDLSKAQIRELDGQEEMSFAYATSDGQDQADPAPAAGRMLLSEPSAQSIAAGEAKPDAHQGKGKSSLVALARAEASPASPARGTFIAGTRPIFPNYRGRW